MKRGNTGVRVRWDTTRKETNRRSGKENGRSNASCVSARQDALAKGSRWDISLRKWNSMRMDGRTICKTSELERHMAWVPPRFYITITPIGSIVFIQTNSYYSYHTPIGRPLATLLTLYLLFIHLTLSPAIDIVDSKVTEPILSAILSAITLVLYFF